MITQIHLNAFRNLHDQGVRFDKNLSVFVGENGSGKTSFLEAIYTLANGKSFRSHKTKTIVRVNSDSDAFILRGHFAINGAERVAALKKSASDVYLAKIDGEPVPNIGVLAALCPTQIIEPKSFNILDSGASQRRRFFDWGVFHVEHAFLGDWKRYVSCLKQRNRLLRDHKPDKSLMAVWDSSLGKYGQQLHKYREAYFSHFIESFDRIKLQVLPADICSKLDISYYPGWDEKKFNLKDQLKDSLVRDLSRKQTHYGAHRSDLKVTYKGLPVTEGLSRGQQKLLVIGLYLTSIDTLRICSNKRAVLLFDDIGAELDDKNTVAVVKALLNCGSKVVCTALDSRLVEALAQLSEGKDIEMFHVEHGKISKTDIFH